MTTLTVRLPVRLKEKVVRLSEGRTGDWVCAKIERARAQGALFGPGDDYDAVEREQLRLSME